MTWADASSSLSSSSWPAASFLDSNEDSPTPSRNGPPIKTYEVRSHISLKLKIKQETRLSKMVHNKALDPGHQPSPAPQNAEPLQRPPPPPSTPATQMNGIVDHTPPPAPPGTHKAAGLHNPGHACCSARATQSMWPPVPRPCPPRWTRPQVAAVEDEMYQQLLKATATLPEPSHAATHAGWEATTMPPAKWHKPQSAYMDQATVHRTTLSWSTCKVPSTAS